MRAHFMARVWSVRRGDATEQGASDYRPLPAPATSAAGVLVAKEPQTPLGVEAASWKNGLAHFGDEPPQAGPGEEMGGRV